MKKFLSLLLAAVMLLSLVACGGNGQNGGSNANGGNAGQTDNAGGDGEVTTVKIGILTFLTGASAALGEEVAQIYQMVADIINEEHPELAMALAAEAGLPNLNGAKIELVVADHKGDANTAVSEAKRLITEEHIVALAGEYTSALIKAVAAVTEQYQIPFMASGSAVTLTDGSNDFEWFFRYAITDETYIKDTFDFIDELNETKDAGIKTVALFTEDSEFGANIRPLEQKYAAEHNLEIVEDISYSSSTTNLSSEVMKIKAADPDVLLMASFVSDALLFFNTCKQQQYTPNFVIAQRGGFIQSDYLEAMGAGNDGICTTGSWAADINTQVTKELKELWASSEYNTHGVDLMDSHVKDAMNLLFLAMAINQAGSTDATAIRDALRNLDYDMDTLMIPWAGIEVNEYGQNTKSNGVVVQWSGGAPSDGGSYKTVYPANAASVDVVYPLADWN